MIRLGLGLLALVVFFFRLDGAILWCAICLGTALSRFTRTPILGHTKIQMTLHYVHPSEEQERLAAEKLATFRLNGILDKVDRSRGVSSKVRTVQ